MPEPVDEDVTIPWNVGKSLQLTGSDIDLESSVRLLLQPHADPHLHHCKSLMYNVVTASCTSMLQPHVHHCKSLMYIPETASCTSQWQPHVHLCYSHTHITVRAPCTSQWQPHVHPSDSLIYIPVTASCTSQWQPHVHPSDSLTYHSASLHFYPRNFLLQFDWICQFAYVTLRYGSLMQFCK
jgi:hypothetical protein